MGVSARKTPPGGEVGSTSAGEVIATYTHLRSDPKPNRLLFFAVVHFVGKSRNASLERENDPYLGGRFQQSVEKLPN